MQRAFYRATSQGPKVHFATSIAKVAAAQVLIHHKIWKTFNVWLISRAWAFLKTFSGQGDAGARAKGEGDFHLLILLAPESEAFRNGHEWPTCSLSQLRFNRNLDSLFFFGWYVYILMFILFCILIGVSYPINPYKSHGPIVPWIHRSSTLQGWNPLETCHCCDLDLFPCWPMAWQDWNHVR